MSLKITVIIIAHECPSESNSFLIRGNLNAKIFSGIFFALKLSSFELGFDSPSYLLNGLCCTHQKFHQFGIKIWHGMFLYCFLHTDGANLNSNDIASSPIQNSSNVHHRILIYKMYIEPVISHGLLVYGSTNKNNLQQIFDYTKTNNSHNFHKFKVLPHHSLGWEG